MSGAHVAVAEDGLDWSDEEMRTQPTAPAFQVVADARDGMTAMTEDPERTRRLEKELVTAEKLQILFREGDFKTQGQAYFLAKDYWPLPEWLENMGRTQLIDLAERLHGERGFSLSGLKAMIHKDTRWEKDRMAYFLRTKGFPEIRKEPWKLAESSKVILREAMKAFQ